MTLRTCTNCGLTKDESEFYSSPREKKCKPCKREQLRESYAANPAPQIARARQWQRENPRRFAAIVNAQTARRSELRHKGSQ